jgi:hypothetical protein
VYKGEEYLARVKQSKELGIGLNDKTLAYLTDEEYSQVVNLAQKSNAINALSTSSSAEKDSTLSCIPSPIFSNEFFVSFIIVFFCSSNCVTFVLRSSFLPFNK